MKYILTLLLFFTFAESNMHKNYHKINEYKSIKIKDDKYQVKIINRSNFLDNQLYLNNNNNNKIIKGNCSYLEENIGVFKFDGNGSIICNDKNIEFISKKLDDNYKIIKLMFFEMILIFSIHIIPSILLIISILSFFISIVFFSRKEVKKGFYSILFGVVFLIFQFSFREYLINELTNIKKEGIIKIIGKEYYIK